MTQYRKGAKGRGRGASTVVKFILQDCAHNFGARDPRRPFELDEPLHWAALPRQMWRSRVSPKQAFLVSTEGVTLPLSIGSITRFRFSHRTAQLYAV